MISPGQGNSSFTAVSALDKILAELKKIRVELISSGGGGGGDATEATQLLVKGLLDILVARDTNTGVATTNTTRVTVDTSQITSILNRLGKDVEYNLATDNTGLYFLEIKKYDTVTDTIVYSYKDISGADYIPNMASIRYIEDASYEALIDIYTYLLNQDTNTGVSTIRTLRVVLEDQSRNNLANILSNLQTANTYSQYENWDKIPGNSKEITWINGALPGNRLVDTIVYKTGITIIVTQTFTYDPLTDEVRAITAS